ncbi:hypothetical protein CRE_16952 [Caenorhabditis remanei]|uniref:CUT domain-containing protein n=1 Tax=Caenorhabditis remanei TaxID=31234 RepID=E3N2A4_CAERE|nr:hypothetical protein CRE_16952 [Caenorhabditis remanei]
MIPIRNIHNQQSPDGMNYTLTQLTTIKYPIDTDGNSRFVRAVPVGFNEWDIVIKEEDRFEMKRTPYGSRDLPIHFAFSSETEYQNESETETIRFNGLHHKPQRCTGMNQKRNPEVQKESLLSTISPNLPKPTQPRIASLSTPPQHSPSMTVERAIEMLSKPIPSEIHVEPLKITEDIRDWMTRNSCSQGFFASNILNVCRSRFNYLLNYPGLYGILKSGKEYSVKMYNWLGMSKDERNQIMQMDLYGIRSAGKVNKVVQISKDFVDVDGGLLYLEGVKLFLIVSEPPKKISRKRPASLRSDTSSESSSPPPSPPGFTHQMITELLNKPVDFVDTKRVSAEIKEWLVESQATQEWFASTIVGRNRRTMGPAINYPRDWNDCASKGQEMFMRMHNWMKLSEMQRQEIMRQHKLKSAKYPKTTISSMKSSERSFRNAASDMIIYFNC